MEVNADVIKNIAINQIYLIMGIFNSFQRMMAIAISIWQNACVWR